MTDREGPHRGNNDDYGHSGRDGQGRGSNNPYGNQYWGRNNGNGNQRRGTNNHYDHSGGGSREYVGRYGHDPDSNNHYGNPDWGRNVDDGNERHPIGNIDHYGDVGPYTHDRDEVQERSNSNPCVIQDGSSYTDNGNHRRVESGYGGRYGECSNLSATKGGSARSNESGQKREFTIISDHNNTNTFQGSEEKNVDCSIPYTVSAWKCKLNEFQCKRALIHKPSTFPDDEEMKNIDKFEEEVLKKRWEKHHENMEKYALKYALINQSAKKRAAMYVRIEEARRNQKIETPRYFTFENILISETTVTNTEETVNMEDNEVDGNKKSAGEKSTEH